MSSRCLHALALVAACLPATLAAQALEPGDRIRGRQCELDECRAVEGGFVSRDADSLKVNVISDGQVSTLSIRVADARVARGKSRRLTVGALLGAASGVAAGLAVQGSSCGEGCGIPPAAGGAIGLLVGGIAGFFITTDRWIAVPDYPRVGGTDRSGIGLTADVVAGRPGVGVRMPF